MKIIPWYQKQVINFWVSRWDYISLTDAIKEINNSGYKGILSIRELKEAYQQIEQYNN